jgi:hypothetical protein
VFIGRVLPYQRICERPLQLVGTERNTSNAEWHTESESLPLRLIEPTELSLRPRCLDILQGPVPCPRILLLPDFCSGIFQRPDVYPCTMHAPDLCSDIMLGPRLFAGIFHAPDLCPCIFLGRPSLELLQQGFGRWLTDFGLALSSSFESGSNFVARRRFVCCR